MPLADSKVILNKGREDSLKRRHPWIFAGAISRAVDGLASGATVDVVSGDGAWLARGAWSPASQMRVRAWTFDEKEPIDAAFFRNRLERAIERRRALLARADLTALRLVSAESDGLPGLVVDRYDDFVVVQFFAAGPERWRGEIVAALAELLKPKGIYERSEGDAREKEGLAERRGVAWGDAPPELIEIREGAVRFVVDVTKGHKTGFYLDQRDNRAALAEVAANREVLNCFAYTGGFGIAAGKAGAKHVVNVDSSADALALAQKNAALNELDIAKFQTVEADVFQYLRQCRDARHQFDVIVLDPPKFAASASQIERASRGYKDINLLAIKLLRAGGTLLTFSCSGHIAPPLFQKIVADAALDARREMRFTRFLSQGEDHPVAANFPEGHYLKGLVCRVE